MCEVVLRTGKVEFRLFENLRPNESVTLTKEVDTDLTKTRFWNFDVPPLENQTKVGDG